jgi:PilZ domain
MVFGFFGKKKYPAVDRRKEARYDAEDEFLLEFHEGSSHYLGHGRDISVHGVRFATTCKLYAKKKVLLNFRLPQRFPGTRHFSVKATVARSYKPLGTERYRVGCRLNHENDETKEILRQFIHWLEHRS